MPSHRHTVSGKPTTYTDVPYANTVDFKAAVEALSDRIDKEVAARVTGDTSLANRLTALEGGTAPTPEPTPTPTPTPTPSPTNPSGEAMPTTVPGWTQLFADDFLTPVPEGSFALTGDPKWGCYPSNWHDTSGNGWYGNAALSVHDSMLDMHLRWLNNRWQVAAPVPTLPGGNARTNIRIAVRFKADAVAGFKTAWLLWPQDNQWPVNGEIDFPEGGLNGLIEAYMHRQGASTGGDQDFRGTGKPFTSWHTAVTEWVAGQSCAFYLDGALLGSVITSRVPSQPMRYVMQTETRLSGGVPPAGADAHVFVDWIWIGGK